MKAHLLALCMIPALACGTSRSAPPPERTAGQPMTNTETTEPDRPLVSVSALQTEHVVMSWGSVEPVPADRPPPNWVIGLIRLTADQECSGVRLTGIRVLDATGNQIASATEELSLRLAPPGRGERDFSEYGTTLWDGTVLPNSPIILRVHGRLNSGFEPRADTMPARYVLVVHLDDGQNIEITGPLDPPWPTG